MTPLTINDDYELFEFLKHPPKMAGPWRLSEFSDCWLRTDPEGRTLAFLEFHKGLCTASLFNRPYDYIKVENVAAGKKFVDTRLREAGFLLVGG